MADVYCDMSLGTGLNDGTSWTDAYQSLATAMSGPNLVLGDIVYVKGTESLSASQSLDGDNNNILTDPVIVLGCKSGTTATPPAQSDLIPGWRTGETRTEANRAYNDGDVPTLTVSDGFNISFGESVHWYGVKFVAGGNINMEGNTPFGRLYEECQFELDTTATVDREMFLHYTSTPKAGDVEFLNCLFDVGDRAGNTINLERGRGYFTGCVFQATVVPTTLFAGNQIQDLKAFIGCDFSDLSGTVFTDLDADNSAQFHVQNCLIPASWTWTSGTREECSLMLNVELTDSTTGKTSGTIKTLLHDVAYGSIVEETTAIRTGGANDSDGGWSYAMTPGVNDTQDNYRALFTPWMAVSVLGDGTTKTLTVFIANTGAGDYQDDEAWLEAVYPSEAGTAAADNNTTQMDLLDTAANITDDTTSSWGTGGDNPQKLELSIAPDYDGYVRCRVGFAKNFSSSPETLYVDPLPVIS